MGEVAVEAVEQDHGPAVGHGEAVAPEPQRQAEPEVGGEQRVWTLPRQVRRRARDPDADRVERLVEHGRARLHGAQQRLGVRDRRGRRERRHRAELAPDRANRPVAHDAR